MYQTIDIETALDQLGRSEKLYKTLVSGFYNRYKDVDQQIEALLNDGDREGARRLAHSLKGLSGNLGSIGLKDKASNLETAIRDSRVDLNERLKDFSHYLSLVVIEVERLLYERFGIDEGPSTKKSDIGSGLQSVLIRLAAALERCRYVDVEDALNQLTVYEVPNEQLNEFRKVRDHIKVFDYDQANAIIRKMITNG